MVSGIGLCFESHNISGVPPSVLVPYAVLTVLLGFFENGFLQTFSMLAVGALITSFFICQGCVRNSGYIQAL